MERNLSREVISKIAYSGADSQNLGKGGIEL